MALELHIFILESRVPSRDDWQQAIEQLGFPTVLESSLDLRRDTGFRPTTYKGHATGFEFSLEPAADIIASYPHIGSRVGNRETCAAFFAVVATLKGSRVTIGSCRPRKAC